MSIDQITKSSPPSSIPFSILDLKSQSVRLPVSKGAQILLSELLTWSGERGYCWWGVRAIAKDLSWSVSSVWRRSTELQESGLLSVIPRPGRSNYWIPLPGRAKMERLQNELTPLATSRGPFLKENEKIKRCTVCNPGTSTEQICPSPDSNNVNAVKSCSQQESSIPQTLVGNTPDSLQESSAPSQTLLSPESIQQKTLPSVTVPKPKFQPLVTADHLVLVEEIEHITEDTWSRGHFLNLVRHVDEQTVYAALSVTKEKMTLESGVNAGAYFSATVKGMMGLAGLGAKSSGSSTTQQSSPTHIAPVASARRKARLEHLVEPEPEPVDPEALKKGWRLSYKSGGVGSLLTWIQRCVPASLDVSNLWTDVRTALPGMEESFAVDRFLDTVVTRMKHAERVVDVG